MRGGERDKRKGKIFIRQGQDTSTTRRTLWLQWLLLCYWLSLWQSTVPLAGHQLFTFASSLYSHSSHRRCPYLLLSLTMYENPVFIVFLSSEFPQCRQDGQAKVVQARSRVNTSHFLTMGMLLSFSPSWNIESHCPPVPQERSVSNPAVFHYWRRQPSDNMFDSEFELQGNILGTPPPLPLPCRDRVAHRAPSPLYFPLVFRTPPPHSQISAARRCCSR